MGTDVVATGSRDLLLPAAVLRLASDERLVEQVHAGSERAFEVLVDRHYRPVLGYCRKMLHSPEEAEDVVQQTFLAAYRELSGMQQPVALRAWLYAIARHRCLSALRATRARPVEAECEPAAEHLIADATTREELRAILRDIAALPGDQRAALVLTELGDVSHAEIAGILGCPPEKVKALVFQARSSLVTGRTARDTSCAEIREQLATRRGAALRRTVLRRHLRECPGCRAFRDTVQIQRRKRNLLLPIVPAAGLKRAVLGALFGSGGSLPGGAAVSVGALSGTGVVAAALATVAIPTAAIAAAVIAPRDALEPAHPVPRAAATAQRAAPATPTTRRPAASLRGVMNAPGHRSPAGGNRNDNEPGAPTRAATPERPERASSRAEAARPPQLTNPQAHPNANRASGPVAPASARHPMTPHKPLKSHLRAKLARPPKMNAKVRRVAPPQPEAKPERAPSKTKAEIKRAGPLQPNHEPRAAEPPKANGEGAPAKPPPANGQGAAPRTAARQTPGALRLLTAGRSPGAAPHGTASSAA